MLRFTGADTRSTIMALDETSQPIELLLSVPRERDARGADRGPAPARDPRRGPAAGARVPSTRDLARQLGVSRRVVVDAYAQLAAEGYLSLRQGARPRVSERRRRREAASAGRPGPALRPRFDFRPSVPDVSTFPAGGLAALPARGARDDDRRRPRLRRPPRGRGAALGPGGLPRARARRRRRPRARRRHLRLLAGPGPRLPRARGTRR